MSYTLNGGFVSEIQRTGAPIWEDLYTVKMPYKHTISLNDLKEFGLPTTGNDLLDKQIHNEVVTIMIPIDAIVEYYRAGIKVVFPRSNELEPMYNTVNRYLIAWKKQLEHGVNISGAPVDDLILLDKFASELYQQTRLINGDKVSPLANISTLLGGNGVIGRDSLFKNLAAGESAAPAGEDKHYSLSSIFSSKIFGGSPTPPEAPRQSTRWK